MPSVTFTTPGPVSLTCPPNITTWQVETWASASAGQIIFGAASPGGGGGAYSCEPELGTVPGVTYHGYVPHGGRPGNVNGGNCVWNLGQVIAYGGQGQQGGAASFNTISYPGGNGGNAGSGGGGGGGESGGPTGAGANGSPGGTSTGGSGGNGGPGAGYGFGGQGGAPGGTGQNGAQPGGGGGGAGYARPTPYGAHSGYGGAGQIRVTWTSAGGLAQALPLVIPPYFPAGYQPQSTDLNSWLHDPFAAIENRPVARFRQTQASQSLPSSGVAQAIQYDTVDEDPLGGWNPSTYAWTPPPGWSAWYTVTVTLCTQAVGTGNIIRPGVSGGGFAGPVASQQPGGGNNGGASGTFWVYLVGGQDSVQGTGALLNATANVSTGIGAAQMPSMQIRWMSL